MITQKHLNYVKKHVRDRLKPPLDQDDVISHMLFCMTKDAKKFNGTGSFDGYLLSRLNWYYLDYIRDHMPITRYGLARPKVGSISAMENEEYGAYDPSCKNQYMPHQYSQRDELLEKLISLDTYDFVEDLSKGVTTKEISVRKGISHSAVCQARKTFLRRVRAEGVLA